jgi:phospholipase/lecithinase/hemolysin
MWRLRAIFVVSCAAFFAATAVASPFSGLIIFGDSLSDVGNTSQASFGIYPGPYYYQARFSNGPVYAEALSAGLGFGPMTRSTAGGNDFAYGGAQTSGTGGATGAFIEDVDEQVSDYLGSRTVDPRSLFEVFSGANDFINGQTNVNVPVGTITAQIGRLVAAGATQFFVPNLPLLGDTPRFNGSAATQTQYNTLTTQFNSSLSTALDNLRANNAALTFFRLDVAGLFEDLRSNPAAYGLTNVTSAAAPGLSPGTLFYNRSRIAPNANQYLFWDDLHPTTTVHSIFAQHALALLTLPGDYNHDGIVDAADYTVWRDAYGQNGNLLAADGDGNKIVDTGDLNIWKNDFGQSSTSGVGANALITVPEPSSVVPGILAGILLVGVRIVRKRSRWLSVG